MRAIDNWDDIQERQDGEYNSPLPGAYIARICTVRDVELREYLEICWDFAEGAYAGENRATYDRAGFWPARIFRSYKESALGFFKAFKTAVEESNPGYRFDYRVVEALVGKKLGVVLGEEEYEKKNGSIGTRLYVYQVRSIQAIQKGDFEVPEKKLIRKPAGRAVDVYPEAGEFAEMGEEDGELPF